MSAPVSFPAAAAAPPAAAGLVARAGFILAATLVLAALFVVAVSAPSLSLAVRLAIVAGLVGCTLAVLVFAGRVVRRFVRAAAEREDHTQALLRLAADLYWEMDRDFRFTRFADPRGLLDAAALEGQIGRTPWEIADVGMSEERLDAHRADLESHRPFAGLRLRRTGSSAHLRIHSVSGEPRFTADGVFDGYWGVARDITEELRARHASKTSETRYRELFERSPSAIFLHRSGFIFDANAAAARLFGFAEPAAMNGARVVDLYAPGETRQRVEARLAELERKKVGDGNAVNDFEMRRFDGRLMSVQATSVRVDALGGPATLTIVFDITARKTAEAALRRSEAMLSHLFATSPDCITLHDLDSGLLAMVNAAFTRLTGYGADEVVGRTSTDIDLWPDLGDRDRLHRAMLDEGRIDEMAATIRTRSGGFAQVRISAARFTMDQREYVVVNARDVTASERTRLEHAAIFERASIGIALTIDRRFAQANPRFEAIFGWPAGQLAGQPGAVVWLDDDEYAEIGRLAGPLLAAGEPFEIEREMRRRDGSRIWCRLLGQAVDPAHPSGGATIWIADDITERRRIDAALAAARDAAESSSRAKSAFLANTSHEIRTPLNGLLGLTRLALRDDMDPPTRRHYLEQILASAEGLEGILSDILDFSKIESGTFTIEARAFDLRELLVAVHASYRPLAEAKGLRFELEIDPGMAGIVTGDPVRVRQILGNFITNAVKFTLRGSVRIHAAPAAAGVRLRVVDTGYGIAASSLEQLFRPFSQVDASSTRRFGGTGLGLSICRQLAELMGGQVGVDSEAGIGSTFWAQLPLAPSLLTGDTLPDPAALHTHLENARILLVEDNPVNMMVAAATLAQWGVEVTEARDGRLALDAVHAAQRAGRPFDLVLMDVQMPVMSGHEATRELRRTYDADALPIIALTAAALVAERDQALAAGMNDFLTKPIDTAKLLRTLIRHVRRDAAGLGDRVAGPLGAPGPLR